MPIFEYECTKCGFVFETYVLTADEKVKCPKCESIEVKKLISAPNLSGISSSSHTCGTGSSGFS